MAGYRTLVWKAFPFRILNALSHVLFVSIDDIEKSKAILISDSWYVTFSFSRISQTPFPPMFWQYLMRYLNMDLLLPNVVYI